MHLQISVKVGKTIPKQANPNKKKPTKTKIFQNLLNTYVTK